MTKAHDDNLRALPSPPSHPDRREQYARIVDPRVGNEEWAANFGQESVDYVRAAALSKADQILALPVPGGWKMVPVEPTEEMILAGYAEKTGGRHATPSRIYRAMLAAAPPSAGGAK